MEIKRNVIKNLKITNMTVITIILGIIDVVLSTLMALEINEIFNAIQNDTFILKNHIIVCAVLLISYCISCVLYPYIDHKKFVMAARNLDQYMTKEILNHNPNFFNDKPVGEILNVVKNIGQSIAFYYSDLISSTVIYVLSLVTVTTVLISLNYKLALIILSIIVFLTILTGLLGGKLSKAFYNMEVTNGDVYNEFEALISNNRIISMTNRLDYFTNKYNNNFNKGYYKEHSKYRFYDTLYSACYTIAIIVIPLLTLVLGILMKDFLVINIGAVLAMYTLVGNLNTPIRVLGKLYPNYKQNKENLNIISKYITNESNPTYNLDDFNALKFNSNGISFNERTILKNINFEIMKDDFVVLSAESGKGKSTILKAIMKEVEDSNISITINNKNISDINYNSKIL